MKHPIMVIETDQAVIRVELIPESAPAAVQSVIDIAKKGLYDNREIRRIAPGFVVQPSFTGFDVPELNKEIPGEFAANGFENGAVMKERSVCMAGDGKSTASCSEFFFCLTDETGARLQGRFPVIGTVTAGWEEVKRLEKVPAHRYYPEGYEDVVIYLPDTPEHMKKVFIIENN